MHAANRHGPGGGGGGGVVLLSGAAANVNVSGGANGQPELPCVPYGATSGSSGIYVSNASLTQDFGMPGGLQCLPDLAITKTHSGAFVAGSTGSYSIVVSNVSAYGATVRHGDYERHSPDGVDTYISIGLGLDLSDTKDWGQAVSCTRSDS